MRVAGPVGTVAGLSMKGHSKRDRFDLLTRRVAVLALVCVLLPTVILGLFAVYAYTRSQRFSAKLDREFIPYGASLVRARLEERYSSECLALLDRFRNTAGVRNIKPLDLTLVFEGRGISESVFQYPTPDGSLTIIPPLLIGSTDADQLIQSLTARLSPLKLDSRLHFLQISLSNGPHVLPYVYSYDNNRNSLSILGLFPDEEYIERVLFPTLLNSDIFSGSDIFQGDLLAKYFAVDINHMGTPVAATRLDYMRATLAMVPLDDILPGYSIGIHYKNKQFQIFQGMNPVMLWGLVGLPTVVFFIGFYLFLALTISEIEVSRAKSHFISNVSHELKTPLGLIRLYNETLELKRFADEKERRGFHRTITREVVRLSNMINRLLSFSRMEQGTKEYDFQPANLAGVVASVMADYGAHIEDAGFEVEQNFDGPIEPLPLDKESISQAVINLLDNAMKYSKENKHITVTVGENAKGPYVEVADSGIGIPQEDIGKIFEKFYRVDQAAITDVKGLGIGLAVVKKIMEDHGGNVEVESKEGEGSRFILRFKREGKKH